MFFAPSAPTPMPKMPVPVEYGSSYSDLDLEERKKKGKRQEWRVLQVVEQRWIGSGRKVILERATKSQDIGGTDGIFIENGVPTLHQSKTRTRGYEGIGIEICRHFRYDITDCDTYPGRDLNSAYDYFDCLTWTKLDASIINVIDGAYQKSMVNMMIDEWTERAELEKPFRSEKVPGAEIRVKYDDHDGHRKLVAYIPISAYPAQVIRQYTLTPVELAFVYG